MEKVKIAILQIKVETERKVNLDKISKLVAEAKQKGAEIVCLPELFADRYLAQEENEAGFALVETIPGSLSRFLAELAKKEKMIIVGGSIFEKREDQKYYNTCLIFNQNGETICKYRKMHVPQDQYYYEQFYFQPGNYGYQLAQTNFGMIAPLICYDQWFPEAARILAIKGVKMIFYPTAIGWFKEMQEAEPFSAQRWEEAMRSHASLNGIYTIACNRVGEERKLNFWGGSFVADPFGQVIARASADREEMLIVELDLNKVQQSQESWGFLRNRRPESYKLLSQGGN